MENKELTSRQLQAIQHIIASPSLEEARKKAKISKGSLYAWLRDSSFKTELKRQRDEVVQEALDQLKVNISKAVNVLVGLMDAKQPNLKYRACKDIIDYTYKGLEIERIEERINKLECLLEGRK